MSWIGQFAILVIALGTLVGIVFITKLPEAFKQAVLYVAVAVLAIWVIQHFLIPLLSKTA